MAASDLGDAAPRNASRLRLFAVLAGLYLAQGIPTYLIAAALPPVLREHGVSRTSIGFFSLLMLPLVLKFAWAPLVDRFPLLRIGHRRGWIIPTQIITALGIAALAFVQPTDIGAIFAICFVVAVSMSTQDIATDGYATTRLSAADRGIGNAIQGGSVAFGVIVGGTLSLVLFEQIGWQATILTVAALSALPLVATLMMQDDGAPPQLRQPPRLRAFFRRPEAVRIFLIALVYRSSEGPVKAMEGPYLVDAGLPLSWIGYLSGASAATAGLAGSVLAAWLLRRSGVAATLVLLGGMRTVCFLAFGLHALDIWSGMHVVMSAAAFQTFIRYMEIVALYSLFMAASSKEQPGTDFTILACGQLVVYLAGSSLAGVMADAAGYSAVFLGAALVSALAVAITWGLLGRRQEGAPRRA